MSADGQGVGDLTDLKNQLAALLSARDRAVSLLCPNERQQAQDEFQHIAEQLRSDQTNPELQSLIDEMIRRFPTSTVV
jgi:hypothetical protein